ncbi:MAG TPA: hypothetical protein PK760_02065 [Flavobacteriales bacterium]|nr:hypothetical protein [Flavobacteriales bacterium]
MALLQRSLLILFLGACGLSTNAQSGLRFMLMDLEPVVSRSGDFVHYGVGFDHDLSKRLSLGVDLRMSTEDRGYVINYRSAYHFADNDGASFYMGPTIGLRRLGDSENTVIVPISFRMGVRGGLEDFYADLYLSVVNNIGGGDGLVYPSSSNYPYSSQVDRYTVMPTSFNLGLSLGWGWAGSR